MGIHESSVNYQNLIRDLAEMYPFDVAEVVFVELIANCLDAGATRISVDFDPRDRVLIVTDNGKGMDAAEFEQYHDFAAGLKTRGTGIGFAGVGAKVSFNIANRVVTETRSESFSDASDWYLQSAKKLIWEDIRPKHLQGMGTRVAVTFKPNAVIPYGRREDLVELLRRHYLALLDTEFLDLYERMGIYSSKLRFIVNGEVLEPGNIATDFALSEVRKFYPTKGSKRVGYGVVGLAASEYPLGPDYCGLLLCTRGKVIKPDLFNQFPGTLGPRIIGLVEVRAFVNFLTTAKTDFMRRSKPREFERLYGPIREEFKTWLGELGIQPAEIAGTDEGAKLERELKKILLDIPQLSDFFGFRTRKAVLEESDTGAISASIHEGIEVTFPVGEGSAGEGAGPVDVGDEPGEALVEDRDSGTKPAKPISRTAPRGPKIAFEERADLVDLAWVAGNNVCINTGHPSYAKARSDSRARTLHDLFAIASAIQRFLAGAENDDGWKFVDEMMAAWGKK
ncbi:MAG: ATP-binding protein [Dehalococcoidia bacterium]|nr:ATP-binding protein [Dehalococcoidia bacterium]